VRLEGLGKSKTPVTSSDSKPLPCSIVPDQSTLPCAPCSYGNHGYFKFTNDLHVIKVR
jgi:hypothetical protein